MGLKVIQPGAFSTIQDAGRFGLQNIGLSPSGAMDYFSLMLGNQLLRNERAMSIEMTMQGGVFQFTEGNAFALTGADMNASLNNKLLVNNQIYNAHKGDVLKLGAAKNGLRTYLSVSGGFDIEAFHGSVSTHTKIKVGGIDGRTLAIDDFIPFNMLSVMDEHAVTPMRLDTTQVRIIPGRQFDYFDLGETKKFKYTISKTSDRMGIRLEGEKIEAKNTYDIISEPVQLGAIQVTSEGQPIVLLNDRQTVGGYAKIGTVYFADLPILVQQPIDSIVTFVIGSLEEAIEEKSKMMKYLKDVPDNTYLTRKMSSNMEKLMKRVK